MEKLRYSWKTNITWEASGFDVGLCTYFERRASSNVVYRGLWRQL